MALSASTTLPYSAAKVTETFTDEAFLRHTSELVGGILESYGATATWPAPSP